MFIAYVRHHITPDEFAKKNEFTQYLISLFTQCELELESEEREKIRKNK